MLSSKAARIVKYLPILAIVLGAFILPAISQAAETASPVIYQSCYQGAPVVEIAWPTPSSYPRYSSRVQLLRQLPSGCQHRAAARRLHVYRLPRARRCHEALVPS